MKEKIVLVPEGRLLFPALNVYDNLMMGGYLNSDKENQEEIERVFDMFPVLKSRRNQFGSTLSGGEQQRVAIARAMVYRPAILLADEPTGNLDPENSWEIMKLLQDVHELGTTVLVVSHNEDIVNKMQKRVITLHKGQITSDARQGGYLQ